MERLRRIILSLAVFFALGLGVAAPAYCQAPNQTRCPVMGGFPNKRLYSDYQGKRVYFCCPPCVREFQKNPEKYMKQMEKQGVVLEEAPGAQKK